MRKRFPESRWHQYDPVNRDAILEGTKLAFGEYVNPVYHLDQTDVILSLDADFLGHGPAKVPMARAFSARRRPSDLKGKPTRLYVAESSLSITGASAGPQTANQGKSGRGLDACPGQEIRQGIRDD